MDNHAVELGSIVRVERRIRTGGGAIAGAVVGGIALGALGAAWGSDPDSGGGGWRGTATALGAAGLGAALGMILGEIASPGKHAWVLVQ